MPNPIEARDWLLYPDRESALTKSMQFLVARIDDRHAAGDDLAVERAVENLLQASERTQDLQAAAEATLEAGLGMFLLGRPEEALSLLEKARGMFGPQDHFVAVALWMKGCVTAELLGGRQHALAAWSECLDIFTNRRDMVLGEQHDQWYADRISEVHQALEVLQEHPESAPKPQPETEGNGWVSEYPEAGRTVTSQEVEGPELQLFRVVEEIPAGGFAPVGYQPFTIGEVNVKKVWIDDLPHRMVNLQDTGNLIFLRSSKYIVARVTGDSMNRPDPKTNREGIDKGDYVLIRLQDTAENGDIVAAEIDGVDDCATLKQLRIEKGGRQIVLMPQSTNPDHQPYEFERFNEGFRVRGVALVVFKPAR